LESISVHAADSGCPGVLGPTLDNNVKVAIPWSIHIHRNRWKNQMV